MSSLDRNKKHICVIGAGPAGIRVTKDLIELGHVVTCYEQMSKIGGIFLKTYDNMMFVSSSLITAWSDFSDECENKPVFWTANEYISYCENFAKKYNLLQHIHFCHKIKEIRKCTKSGKWIVTVQNNVNNCEFSSIFHAIAVCSGANSIPVKPTFLGEERFKGEIIHSAEYINSLKFTDKRVLIVGSGESAADIMNEVSLVASKTAIMIRGKHGHIIPRYQGDSDNVTDLNTNRCRYSNAYMFGDMIGYTTQWFKWIISKISFKTSKTNSIISKISELNMMQRTSAFSKYGCKSSGFVEAIVLRNAELFRTPFELFENKAVFEDGRTFDCDAIISCTGYKSSFSFFDNYHPEISKTGINPRLNYKQIFNIEHNGEIAFFGCVRPAFGAIPPIIEMQSRLFSYVINGEVMLPSKEEQTLITIQDEEFWTYRFKYDAVRNKSIVDYQLYCDSLARLMGVMPNLQKVYLEDVYMWKKLMYGPLTMHQYRLSGIYSDIDRAIRIIKKQPYGDVLESVITSIYLLLSVLKKVVVKVKRSEIVKKLKSIVK